MTKVKVQIKNVYGNELIYPACEQSEIFAKIAGSQTLTQQTIDYMKQLGIQFIIESQTI